MTDSSEPWHDEDTLRELYVEKGLSLPDIGDKLGCHGGGTISYWLDKYDISRGDECPHCGNQYDYLGSHWASSPECDYPEITDEMAEIITGVLMGDGSLNMMDGKNPAFGVLGVEREFLEHLNNELQWLTTGVTEGRSAGEKAKDNRKRGFGENPSEERYSDQYQLNGRRHPGLNRWKAWYESGEKRFPDNLELTPTIIKYWFVTDGSSQHRDGRYPEIRIHTINEGDRIEWVASLFEPFGLDPRPVEKGLYFGPDDTRELYELMGDPIPGFEYKWKADEVNPMV